MKALILNSGLGSRMGVLISEHPKCMTEISSHETILSRQLRLIADAGVEVKASLGARGDLGRPTTTALENKKMFMNYLNDL